MEDSILVKLQNDGEYLGIHTYDRKHGRKGRFLLTWQTIMMLMMGTGCQIQYEMDCGNFAELWRDKDQLFVRLTWLSEYSDRSVGGFRQTIHLPKVLIFSMLEKTNTRRYLCQPDRRLAKLDWSDANKTIQKVKSRKLSRRALAKALRSYFLWPGEEVKFYNDGGYNFYFTTKSGFPKCGGLILHTGGEKTGYPYVYYSVHT